MSTKYDSTNLSLECYVYKSSDENAGPQKPSTRGNALERDTHEGRTVYHFDFDRGHSIIETLATPTDNDKKAAGTFGGRP